MPAEQEKPNDEIPFLISERVNHINYICRKISNQIKSNVAENVPKFLKIESKGLLLAEVPKVGCTNWKKVIIYLEGTLQADVRKQILQLGEINKQIIGFPDPTRRGYTHLLEPKWSHGNIININQLNNDQINIIQNNKKMVVVRNRA